MSILQKPATSGKSNSTTFPREILADNIPLELRRLDRWLVWGKAGGFNKKPLCVRGGAGSSTNPATWAAFAEALHAHQSGGYRGIGFALLATDCDATGESIVGVDLDHVRNPQTGEIVRWARDVIEGLHSYSEISPSGEGIRIFIRGKLANTRCKATGKEGFNGQNNAAMEVYDSGRYLTVTGWHLDGTPAAIERRTEDLRIVCAREMPEPTTLTSTPPSASYTAPTGREGLIQRAKDYLATMDLSISGQRGHDTTLRVASALVNGFSLSIEEARPLMAEYNNRCEPPWSEREIDHKLNEAVKIGPPAGKVFGWLAGAVNYIWDGPDWPEVTDTPAPQGGDGASADDLLASLTRKFSGVSSAEFAVADYRREWLVKGLLVRGEPTVIGGPQKSLKTSVLVDLALGIGSGSPVLGKFEVPRPARVLFISGESGGYVIRQTAERICTAHGIVLEDAEVRWAFDLPQLGNPLHLRAIANGIRQAGIEVVIIDPLYLSLLAGEMAKGREASNLFDMGPLLASINTACRDAGATLIVAHHSHKRIERGKPMELSDLAFSGLPEFAAQWLLLSRRERYDGDGVHKLWLNVGGRAGQGGVWQLDIDEGRMDEDFTGRTWNVTLERASEVSRQQRNEGQQRRQDARTQTDQADDVKVLSGIDTLLCDNADFRRIGWVSRRKLRERTGMRAERLGRAIGRLIEVAVIEEKSGIPFPCGRGTREAEGIRRRTRTPREPDLFIPKNENNAA